MPPAQLTKSPGGIRSPRPASAYPNGSDMRGRLRSSSTGKSRLKRDESQILTNVRSLGQQSVAESALAPVRTAARTPRLGAPGLTPDP